MRSFIKYILDSTDSVKFRTDYKSYAVQCFMIFLCVSAVLVLGGVFDAVIVASLGASSFILFAAPHANLSRPRYVIGGYFCGSVSGILFNFISNMIISNLSPDPLYLTAFLGAASVSAATFLMVTANLEHPPAAALALGLTAESQCVKASIAAIAGVSILCIIKNLLKKRLIDLI